MSGKKLMIALNVCWLPFVYAPSLDSAAYGVLPLIATIATLLIGLCHYNALRRSNAAAEQAA